MIRIINGILDMFVEAFEMFCGLDAPTQKYYVNQVRNFKPTISHSFWGKLITWEEREKPLTDDELKSMYQVEDKYL